jgi:pSer/pThr/pTyr-binding forkhead associated (FHA) protein
VRLRYTDKAGAEKEFDLGEKPVTIGRSSDADLVFPDEKASRIHCGIRLWDGDFYVKDLKSRNGTFVNDQRVDLARLRPGDRIRVGSTVLSVEQEANEHAGIALKEVEQRMAEGKGYSTILQEIVGDINNPSADTQPGDAQHPRRRKSAR